MRIKCISAGETGISNIFYSETIGKQLEKTSRNFHIDGTFFIVPKIYKQLLIIHVERRSKKNHVSILLHSLNI